LHYDVQFTASLRPKNVRGVQAHARRQTEDDIGHRRPVGRALFAFIGKGLLAAGRENAAGDRINLLAALAKTLLPDCLVHAAINQANRDPFSGGARVVQQPLRSKEREDVVEDVAVVGGRSAHGRVSPSPVAASSRARTLSTTRMQCSTAPGPCRTASTRMPSASRRVP